jgi:UDP-2,3-diacylglucosamine hydrolase
MITDVNADTVAATMARFGVRRMIHGHTHRPAMHSLRVNGMPAQRIVLATGTSRARCCASAPKAMR